MKSSSFVLIVCLLGAGAAAHADDRAAARAQFKAGSQHYNLGEYQQALDAFKQAYRSYEDPSFLYNIAQCHRQLGHKREAISAYRAYLNNSDQPQNREQVKQIIGELESQLASESAEKPAPAPATTTSPEAAQVRVAPATPTTMPALTATAPAAPERTPTYKKWWVWTIVGGVVAAGAATGIALALTSHPSSPTASTSLGTFTPY